VGGISVGVAVGGTGVGEGGIGVGEGGTIVGVGGGSVGVGANAGAEVHAVRKNKKTNKQSLRNFNFYLLFGVVILRNI